MDDVGAELLGKAIEGLSNPAPDSGGEPDRRSPAVRRGQAFKEVLTRYLNVGDTPTHGGERPHITLTMNYQDLKNRIGAASLELGGVIGAGEVRLLACDANIIPMVMGTKSEVLGGGRAKRLFPAPIRKAITQRDRGCCFPGCDRPPAWTRCAPCFVVARWWDQLLQQRVPAVPFDHTVIHQGHWKIQWGADGIPEFIPPPWVDPGLIRTENPDATTTIALQT